MSSNTVKLVLTDNATAYTIWTNTLGHFNNNKTNIKKDVADAITKFGTPVSKADLVTNVVKGLHERFDNVADIAPSSRHSHRSSCSTTCCFSRR
jgi:hypothetical protein